MADKKIYIYFNIDDKYSSKKNMVILNYFFSLSPHLRSYYHHFPFVHYHLHFHSLLSFPTNRAMFAMTNHPLLKFSIHLTVDNLYYIHIYFTQARKI